MTDTNIQPSLLTLLSPEAQTEYGMHSIKKKASKTSTLNQRYVLDPIAYAKDILGITPWEGPSYEEPGQTQILEAYTLAIKQQKEKIAFELGELTEDELQVWTPGELIKNRISVDAGHGVSKTNTGAIMANHFLDMLVPAIGYCYAPTLYQIHDLLFKEVKALRRSQGLPGRILDLEIRVADDRFVKGRAASDRDGLGTERAQGQHSEHLLFIVDEAEAIPPFIWEAIEAMASGGLVIVLILRNPRTTTCYAHKLRSEPRTHAMRISCLWHPNVVHGKNIIPGAVTRDYVDTMLRDHCTPITPDIRINEEKDKVVTVPWRPGESWVAGIVFRWRVLGEAVADVSGNTFFSSTLFTSACERMPDMYATGLPSSVLQVGVDVARFGDDTGTIYAAHAGLVWRYARLEHTRVTEYYREIRQLLEDQHAEGARNVSIRVDGGGGYGGGIVDLLLEDFSLQDKFASFVVHEVHFNAPAQDQETYYDTVTQMYGESAKQLRTWAVKLPESSTLETDLTARAYDWGVIKKVEVKKLQQKLKFKDDFGFSPDDGDGFTLALAPEITFTGKIQWWDNSIATEDMLNQMTGRIVDNLLGMGLEPGVSHPFEKYNVDKIGRNKHGF